MSDIVYDLGYYEKDAEDIIHLCSTWWEDSAFYKNTNMPFKVDRSQFKAMSDTGQILAITGRKEDTGELIACYVGSITPYYFNPDYLMASEIVWCIHKDYRKGREMFNLLKAIELGMKTRKVNMYTLCIPILEGKEMIEKYMTRKLDFFVQDSVLMKEVKYG